MRINELDPARSESGQGQLSDVDRACRLPTAYQATRPHRTEKVLDLDDAGLIA